MPEDNSEADDGDGDSCETQEHRISMSLGSAEMEIHTEGVTLEEAREELEILWEGRVEEMSRAESSMHNELLQRSSPTLIFGGGD